MKQTKRSTVQEIAPDKEQGWLQDHMENFAQHLDTARILWRRYPTLVEAPEYPEPFLEALRREGKGTDPGTVSLCDEPLVERGILKRESGENRAKSLEDFRKQADPSTPKGENNPWYVFVASAFDPEMAADEKAMLAIFQRILREGQICADSPVEELLRSLVFEHGYCRPLTQENVHRSVEEFDSVWEDNVRMVRRFYKEHEELVTA
jgi:hypothetical protein